MQVQMSRKVRRAAAALGLNAESLVPNEVEQVQNAVIEQVRVRILPDGRMDTDNAAAYIGIATKTLD
jgi:hypothetical protein